MVFRPSPGRLVARARAGSLAAPAAAAAGVRAWGHGPNICPSPSLSPSFPSSFPAAISKRPSERLVVEEGTKFNQRSRRRWGANFIGTTISCLRVRMSARRGRIATLHVEYLSPAALPAVLLAMTRPILAAAAAAQLQWPFYDLAVKRAE